MAIRAGLLMHVVEEKIAMEGYKMLKRNQGSCVPARPVQGCRFLMVAST